MLWYWMQFSSPLPSTVWRIIWCGVFRLPAYRVELKIIKICFNLVIIIISFRDLRLHLRVWDLQCCCINTQSSSRNQLSIYCWQSEANVKVKAFRMDICNLIWRPRGRKGHCEKGNKMVLITTFWWTMEMKLWSIKIPKI